MFLMCLRYAQTRSYSTSYSRFSFPPPYLPPRRLGRLCGTSCHLTPPPLGKNHGFAPDMTCFLCENQDIPIYFRIYLRKP